MEIDWISCLIMIVVAALVFLVMKYITDAYNKKTKKNDDDNREEVVEETIETVHFATRDAGNSLLNLLNVDSLSDIPDQFEKLDDVTAIIRKAGITSVNLIFGIDYTASNYKQGAKTFGGKSLHDVTTGPKNPNPYKQVIEILGKTIEPLNQNGHIPAYGFGDSSTRDVSVFPLKSGVEQCHGFEEVLKVYNKVTPTIRLSGPTNFAPLIYQAISAVQRTKAYHILVIVADGQVTREAETKKAIIDASKHPLSIIMIGVGDGPWDDMDMYDDQLPERRFDNFHFVDFHKVTESYSNPEAAFAIQALLEIPDQYTSIQRLGYLR